jgi:hypothetical protein
MKILDAPQRNSRAMCTSCQKFTQRKTDKHLLETLSVATSDAALGTQWLIGTKSPASVSAKTGVFEEKWSGTFGISRARFGELGARRRNEFREKPVFPAFSRVSWKDWPNGGMAAGAGGLEL